MPTKAKPKDGVTVSFTQEEAKDVAVFMQEHKGILQSIGAQVKAARCEALRAKVVHASGKVPAP